MALKADEPPPPFRIPQNIGTWGEALTALCLEREFHGVQIAMTGSSHVAFDILVLDPEKKAFERPAIIAVKTHTTNSSSILLSYKELEAARDQAASGGMEFYLSLVNYSLGRLGLSFGIYLVKASSLIPDDFTTVKAGKGSTTILRALNVRKKASWVFRSGNSFIPPWTRDDIEDKGSEEEAGGRRDDDPGASLRPEPGLTSVMSNTIGYWGEYQTIMLLEKAYKEKGLVISRFDTLERDIDLYILRPCKDSLFLRRSTISCKAAERYVYTLKVTLDQWKRMLEAAEANGEELWFSIIQYVYKDRSLTFKDYMIRARDLNERDFRSDVIFGGKRELFLDVRAAIKKASMTFGTRCVRKSRRYGKEG